MTIVYNRRAIERLSIISMLLLCVPMIVASLGLCIWFWARSPKWVSLIFGLSSVLMLWFTTWAIREWNVLPQKIRPQETWPTPIRPWVFVLGSAASITVAAIQTPRALKDIDESALLAQSTHRTRGTVQEIHGNDGKNKCSSRAIISYAVGTSTFETSVEGCGASPSQLMVGQMVEVEYVASAPYISKAFVPGAQTFRFSPLQLFLLWFLSGVLSVLAYLSRRFGIRS